MKLNDAINRIDRSEDNRNWISHEKFYSELQLNYDYDIELRDHGFDSFWLFASYCTDTWVGVTVIFYQNEPIVVTDHPARKSDMRFLWIGGRETRDRIHKIVRDLPSKVEPIDDCEAADLDDEIGDGCTLTFTNQLLGKVVFDKETGERFEVTTRNSREYLDKKINVVDSTGAARTVELVSVRVPFHLAPEI